MKGRAIAYSASEMTWLEENRAMVISDYFAGFRAAFGREDVTAANLHSLRKRKGWKVGRGGGRLAGRHRRFSTQEIAWLHENVALPTEDWLHLFHAAFGRADVTAGQLISLRKRMRWKTGRNGRFESGHAPSNKGRCFEEGRGGRHPNARKNQFKKGRAPHNTRGPGHESLGADGYIWIVTDRRNPWTGASTWRVHKHRWLWEQQNGPVPKGYVLKSLDGDRLNCDPSNWQLIPKGLLPRLNGKSGRSYDGAPADLKPLIMTVAKLEHAARQRSGRGRP